MKVLKTLADLKTLNDENAKEYSFANIANLVDAGFNLSLTEEITRIAKEHQANIQAKEEAVANSQKESKAALAEAAQLKADLAAVNAKLEALEKTQQESIAAQVYNDRMAYFDDNYELNDSDRKALASSIAGLSEEDFKDFSENKFAVFAAEKKKDFIAKKKAEKGGDAEDATDGADDEGAEGEKAAPFKKKTAKASTEDASSVAKQALANTKTTTEDVANTPTQTQTLKEKYAAAFKNGAGVSFSKNKR